MEQTITTCQERNQRGTRKWLMWLLMVNIISLSLGVLTKAMYIGFMNSWLQIVCSMGALFCLFQLRREHKLYIVAIIFCSIDLIGTLVQTLLFSDDGWRLMRELYQEDFYNVIGNITIVISRILLISGLAAGVFEYLAHNRLIKTTDQRLSKYWIWLTVGMLILFAAMRVMDWIVADMLEKETLDIEQYQKLNPLMNLPAMLLRIGYVVCLFVTWRGKAREEAALLCEDAEPCTEEERESQKKRLYIALGLGAIGIALICVPVALAIISINKMSIIGGADWFSFRFILSNGENGLYAMMISFGCAAILASVIDENAAGSIDHIGSGHSHGCLIQCNIAAGIIGQRTRNVDHRCIMDIGTHIAVVDKGCALAPTGKIKKCVLFLIHIEFKPIECGHPFRISGRKA